MVGVRDMAELGCGGSALLRLILTLDYKCRQGGRKGLSEKSKMPQKIPKSLYLNRWAVDLSHPGDGRQN